MKGYDWVSGGVTLLLMDGLQPCLSRASIMHWIIFTCSHLINPAMEKRLLCYIWVLPHECWINTQLQISYNNLTRNRIMFLVDSFPTNKFYFKKKFQPFLFGLTEINIMGQEFGLLNEPSRNSMGFCRLQCETGLSL